MNRLGAALILLAGLVAAGMAQAQAEDPAIAAQRAAQLLRAAEISLEEAEGARDRVEALTETVRAYEQGLLALREGIRRAARREAALTARLDTERERLARLLGAMQAVEAAPAPVLTLHPTGPLDAARSGMILSEITPAVARDATALRNDVEALALMRALQESSLDQLSAGLTGVQDARTQLSQAIADRTDLPPRFETDPEALATLREASATLDAFADALRDQPTGAILDAALPRFSDARGELPMPAVGRVLAGYGQADASGIARPGLLLATAPGSLVTAPWPGTVRYAGPLLDYGNVVILEPDADHMLVFAGLGEVFVRTGEVLTATAPLGLMDSDGPASDNLIAQFAAEGGGGLSETLYMEVREGDGPVDPALWFGIGADGN